jgi:hypothetical protein
MNYAFYMNPNLFTQSLNVYGELQSFVVQFYVNA